MYARGFLGSVPTQLIRTVLATADVASWSEAYVACSGTFRTERMLLSGFPKLTVRSNDVSLFSCGMGRWLVDAPHDFRFIKDLAFIEELGLSEPVERLAAIIVVMNISGYAVGKRNAYKNAHMAHFRQRFLGYVAKTVKKIGDFKPLTPIASFHARDWLEHVDEAIEKGAGVLAYPPTYKSGYEKLFAFINDNVEWEQPKYAIWDPARLGEVIEKLEASNSPYFVYSDRKIDGRAPAIEFDQNGFHTVYGYARAKRAAFLARSGGAGQQFRYKAIEPARLTKHSKVTLARATGAQMDFLRNVYLKKTIRFAGGAVNLLVYIDDMLAGGIIYRNDHGALTDKLGVFLLSDFSTTREGRIAKLIARVATSKEAVGQAERHYVQRFHYVSTAVFSDNPVSMKYRGTMDLMNRKETGAGKFQLFYKSDVRDETAQQSYDWYWLGQARGRNSGGGPKKPKAA